MVKNELWQGRDRRAPLTFFVLAFHTPIPTRNRNRDRNGNPMDRRFEHEKVFGLIKTNSDCRLRKGNQPGKAPSVVSRQI